MLYAWRVGDASCHTYVHVISLILYASADPLSRSCVCLTMPCPTRGCCVLPTAMSRARVCSWTQASCLRGCAAHRGFVSFCCSTAKATQVVLLWSPFIAQSCRAHLEHSFLGHAAHRCLTCVCVCVFCDRRDVCPSAAHSWQQQP